MANPLAGALGARTLRALLRAAGDPPIRIRLWDGAEVGAPLAQCPALLRVHDPGALWRLVADPEMALGDLFVDERVTVEGDLVGFLRALFERSGGGGLRDRLPAWLRDRPGRTGLGRATRNARHHYDLGNEFYALWLDENMLYTCAYFPSPEVGLEEAQLAKMDHVCRKLALRPGETVIEAGCGWGSLALHMARYYGVRVRACNVSRAQILYAREQAEKRGLQDRVEFVEDDYRNLRGECDAFVSVGMLEHVGPDHYPALGAVLDRCLRPDGRGLIHTIGRSRPMRLNRWMRTRVFPDAHPPTLGEMMRIFEPRDLAVLDVENLRLHYERTGRHWLERYERAIDRVESLVGRRVARTWHLYLAAVVASFGAATLQLYQVVFTRARNDAIPWTRAHVYGDAADGFGGAAGALAAPGDRAAAGRRVGGAG